MQAMRPTDLGKLEGPCPRYIVPSAGGVGHLTGNFPLPETGDIKDLDEFLKSPFAPRQQMLRKLNVLVCCVTHCIQYMYSVCTV